MSPITAQEAWDATDPSMSDEDRQRAAESIMAGVAANDAYLSSRGELEQLIAHAQGGQVASHAEINSGNAPGGEVSGSAAAEIPTESGPPTVDSTVVPGSESESPDTSQSAGESSGDTSSESAEDKLRAQLLKYGITPDA